jgi:hypothetical protein
MNIGLLESDNGTGLLLDFIYRLLSDIASTVCHGLGGRDRKRRYNVLIGGELRQRKIFRTENCSGKIRQHHYCKGVTTTGQNNTQTERRPLLL